MNRRQKIIVSITGIFIVLLALVGLTYAYFLTRITGNNNDKSISVTTKYLELIYDDGTSIIEGIALEPITSGNIKTKAVKKTFSIAKAEKSDDIYAKLEMADIVISDNLKDYDFKWALYQGETKITTGTFVQTMSSDRIVLANNILVNSTTPTEYDLYIWIDETGTDQSKLMGGSLTARIESSGTGHKLRTLASVILGENNSNVIATTPTFSASTDKGLFVQQAYNETDEVSEYGFPTYYYRGSVTNNYVNFAGFTWKIVRINEDGSIKLMTVEPIANSTLWDDSRPYTTEYMNSSVKTIVENWFDVNIPDNIKSKVITSTFCNDTSNNFNGAYTRIISKTPLFTCANEGKTINSKVGLLTADEMLFSGAGAFESGNTYMSDNHYIWSMTPATTISSFYLNRTELNNYKDIDIESYIHGVTGIPNGWVHAVINLSADTLITRGSGSIQYPYTYVEEDNKNKTYYLEHDSDFTNSSTASFSMALTAFPEGSTIMLGAGEYSVSIIPEYNIPKNITIVGGENVIIKSMYPTGEGTIEGLTLSNLTFVGSETNQGIYSTTNFKNLTIRNCTFENGASIRLGMGTNAVNLTNENITIKNNVFSGTISNLSHIHITNSKGTTTIMNNISDGGRNIVQLGSILSGTANIINNKLSNSTDAAFRFGSIGENVKVNVIGNTIVNAVKPSTGAIARIGNNSGLPSTSKITFDNNTYNGSLWDDSEWQNEGYPTNAEFGIDKDGNIVAS